MVSLHYKATTSTTSNVSGFLCVFMHIKQVCNSAWETIKTDYWLDHVLSNLSEGLIRNTSQQI